jgi:hypothetical protein
MTPVLAHDGFTSTEDRISSVDPATSRFRIEPAVETFLNPSGTFRSGGVFVDYPRVPEDMQGVAPGTVEQVEAHVQRRLGGQVNDLRVVVRGEGLVLQGRTRTYHAKQLAQHAVMEITELPILANEIRV